MLYFQELQATDNPPTLPLNFSLEHFHYNGPGRQTMLFLVSRDPFPLTTAKINVSSDATIHKYEDTMLQCCCLMAAVSEGGRAHCPCLLLLLCCAALGEAVTLMVNVNDTLMDCSGRWAGPIIDDTCTSQLSLSKSRSGYSYVYIQSEK